MTPKPLQDFEISDIKSVSAAFCNFGMARMLRTVLWNDAYIPKEWFWNVYQLVLILMNYY